MTYENGSVMSIFKRGEKGRELEMASMYILLRSFSGNKDRDKEQ